MVARSARLPEAVLTGGELTARQHGRVSHRLASSGGAEEHARHAGVGT